MEDNLKMAKNIFKWRSWIEANEIVNKKEEKNVDKREDEVDEAKNVNVNADNILYELYDFIDDSDICEIKFHVLFHNKYTIQVIETMLKQKIHLVIQSKQFCFLNLYVRIWKLSAIWLWRKECFQNFNR